MSTRPGHPGHNFDEQRALEQLAGDVLTCLGLGDKSLEPRSEAIDPAFDRVFVFANLGNRERGAPTIVAKISEGDLRPLGG